MEMRRTEHEAAVSRSDDCKIVADTPPDESYVVLRTSTGVRISSQLNDEEVTGDGSVTLGDDVESESLEFRVKEEPDLDFETRGEAMMIDDTVEKPMVVVEAVSRGSGNECVSVGFKQEPENLETEQTVLILSPKPVQVIPPKPECLDVESDSLKQERSGTHVKMEVREEKPVYVKKVNTQEVDARKAKVEDGDFPVERDWYLVGRSLVTATSTSKGRRLEDNEVVNFAFPSTLNLKVPNIVRFSTKRCGEVIPFTAQSFINLNFLFGVLVIACLLIILGDLCF